MTPMSSRGSRQRGAMGLAPERSIEPPEDPPARLQCDTCDFTFTLDDSSHLEEGDDCPLRDDRAGEYCDGTLKIYDDAPWRDREE